MAPRFALLVRATGWLLAGAFSAAAHAGFLLPSSEAAKRDQLACQPTAVLGVLECEQLSAPPPPVRNDPSIYAPEFVANSGPSIPEQQVEAPMLPVLDALPARLKNGPLTIAWDIWFGTAGQWWEVWDNDVLRYRGRDFSRRTRDNAPPVQGERVQVTELAEARLESVQSGVFQLAKLTPGEHQFRIKLCNGTLEAPLCTEVRAATWVEAGEEPGAVAEAGPPDAPALAWIPQITTDGVVTVAWNLWWGNPGTHWEVLNGSKVVYRSDKFTENNDRSQAGQVNLPLANGVHELSVRLCRRTLCAGSEKIRVEAMLGPELLPAKPVLALFTPDDPDLGDGLLPTQVLLSWKTEQPGVAPDRWLLIDQTTREVLYSQALKTDCGNGVWCGSWQGVPASRPASWRVKLCQAKRCVDSDVLQVPAVGEESGPAVVEPLGKPTAAQAQ
ncbi:chitinase N-terminal domain-containing protein [Chitinibacter tainanensis]|uniref:chitinase N-terminal domain-containing protein n=1 Tax=Chitinibacter tainanensis TaxID=230667 RepID=UPI00040D3577|nr:chitinase N-terminal domain-containing protein [Chitinibacter tainanensis]